MLPLEPLHSMLAPIALVGHAASWCGLFSWLHALPLSCRIIRLLERLIMIVMAAAPVWVAWEYVLAASEARGLIDGAPWSTIAAQWYVGFCLVAAPIALIRWTWLHQRKTDDGHLLENHTTVVKLPERIDGPAIGDAFTRLLAALPGNQILQLHVQRKTLLHRRLPPALNELTIAHLSDLHMSGQFTREFFEEVIAQTNALGADLTVLTGDIAENAACIDWIAFTAARLRSPGGVYFVLGNHDIRTGDTPALRRALVEGGLIDLGGRATTLRWAGEKIALAGNELPWFPFPAGEPPLDESDEVFRILLSHSPDQLRWAQQRKVDLMLAGHTHGGQVRFPVIGPVVAPSRFGVKYAAGVFYEAPTLMHVSRGVSGLHTLRVNCPPELTLLTLRRDKEMGLEAM